MIKKTLILCWIFWAFYPLALPGSLYALESQLKIQVRGICRQRDNFKRQADQKDVAINLLKTEWTNKKPIAEQRANELRTTAANVMKKVDAEKAMLYGKGQQAKGMVAQTQGAFTEMSKALSGGDACASGKVGPLIQALERHLTQDMPRDYNKAHETLKDWAEKTKACADSAAPCDVKPVPSINMPDIQYSQGGGPNLADCIPPCTGKGCGAVNQMIQQYRSQLALPTVRYQTKSITYQLGSAPQMVGQELRTLRERMEAITTKDVPSAEKERNRALESKKQQETSADSLSKTSRCCDTPGCGDCKFQGGTCADAAARLKKETEALLKQAQSLMDKGTKKRAHIPNR